MSADPPSPPDASPDRRSALLLDEALRALGPLVKMLVARGVGYPQLAQLLKPAFMTAARDQLAAEGARVTDAAISVRSGVHRKDVRQWTRGPAAASDGATEAGQEPATHGSVADQVFTRWTTDAGYRSAAGGPAPLPLTGPPPSFDSLVQAVTRDLSRRTVLDELTRLGLAREADGMVVPMAEAAIPQSDQAEMLRYLASHLHDHAAAGVANLDAAARGERPPFLEHAMYATGLSDASIEQLRQLAVQLWKPAFGQMVDASRQRHAMDETQALNGRIRFGVYFYSEPADHAGAAAAATDRTATEQAKGTSDGSDDRGQ